MKLEDQLKEQGYTAAVAELDELKRLRGLVAGQLLIAKADKSAGIAADLAELEDAIAECEAALDAEYRATVARVDSENDLDFQMEILTETAELVIEEVETNDPAKAAEMRKLFPERDE